MTTIRFDVHGHPAPQGSKTAVMRGARPHLIEAGNQNSRQRHHDWRTAVTLAALAHVPETGPLDGPLALTVTFRFPMPTSRPKHIQTTGIAWKTSAPDLDKLIRATGDALTAAGIIRDDARIVTITARKIEVVSWTGATIELTDQLEVAT
jgi:Holliday junction resolvase RusA-like endonuclease